MQRVGEDKAISCLLGLSWYKLLYLWKTGTYSNLPRFLLLPEQSRGRKRRRQLPRTTHAVHIIERRGRAQLRQRDRELAREREGGRETAREREREIEGLREKRERTFAPPRPPPCRRRAHLQVMSPESADCLLLRVQKANAGGKLIWTRLGTHFKLLRHPNMRLKLFYIPTPATFFFAPCRPDGLLEPLVHISWIR